MFCLCIHSGSAPNGFSAALCTCISFLPADRDLFIPSSFQEFLPCNGQDDMAICTPKVAREKQTFCAGEMCFWLLSMQKQQGHGINKVVAAGLAF